MFFKEDCKSFLKAFHSTGETDEQHKEIVQCLEKIVCDVFGRTGVSKCVRLPSDDTSIAFSGSREEPELHLTLEWQRYDRRKYIIYASLDDECSWFEWNFADRSDFCESIADHIAERVDSTIRTVTEKVKHKSIRTTVYKMTESGEWQLISDDFADQRQIRHFITEDSIEETVKEYRIL